MISRFSGVIYAFATVFALSTVSGAAQDASTAPQYPDFSAKFVKPPKKGATKRITVQVPYRAEPAIPPRPGESGNSIDVIPAAIPDAGAGNTSPTGRFAWFWQHISPELSASAPGRLETAMLALSKGPEGRAVGAPRLQDLQGIASEHGRSLLLNSVGTQISPALALAVIAVESAGQSDATSHAGAQGLMQLMPETAKHYGVEDLTHPEQNIKGGIAFLDALMKKYERDPILVLAAYNAGETAVAEHGGVPPFAETRDYVPKVLAAFQIARGLCVTPPELISDGCVFRVMVKG